MNKIGVIDLNRPHRTQHCARGARGSVTRPCLIFLTAAAIAGLTSCATTSRHQFTEPSSDWQARSGQLLYRNANATLIGDAFVRFSKKGDFELNFSKGPVTLLSLREDTTFVEVSGPLARMGWSGPIDSAPSQLRGWLGLRDKIIQSEDRKFIQYAAGAETFLLRF